MNILANTLISLKSKESSGSDPELEKRVSALEENILKVEKDIGKINFKINELREYVDNSIKIAILDSWEGEY